MTWLLLLLGVVASALLIFLARRRGSRFAVGQSDPMSTIHGDLSKKQSARKRAALAAATASLR